MQYRYTYNPFTPSHDCNRVKLILSTDKIAGNEMFNHKDLQIFGFKLHT